MKSIFILNLMVLLFGGSSFAASPEPCFKVPFESSDANAFQARLSGRLEVRDNKGKQYTVLVLNSPICVEGKNLRSGKSFRYPSVNEVQLWAGLIETTESLKVPEVVVQANIYTREVHPRGNSRSIVLPVFVNSKGIMWDWEKPL